MSLVKTKNNREEIAKGFSQLLEKYQSHKSQIATKEEEIAKTQNQALLVKTKDYTVGNIVNAMASLQLSFGDVVGELAQELEQESHKLEELRQAIAVEREHLERLKQVRLVADALYILNQEHQAKKAALQVNTAQIKEKIELEIMQTKQQWDIEQAEFTNKVQETAESVAQARRQEAADYQYELERQRTIEQDEYETDKRLQAIAIAELETGKNKDWSEREKYLGEHQAEFKLHQEAISGFEARLNEEYNKVKGKAIKEADSKYKVAADLREKEWSAIEQGYELKIASLTAVGSHQAEQVAEIMGQLQEANAQAQNLALQAFQHQPH